MRQFFGLFTAALILLSCTVSTADDYEAAGTVTFTNLQGFLATLETVPYTGKGFSSLNKNQQHSGSIMATSVPAIVYEDDAITVLEFTGIQGPNPRFGKRNIHLIVGQGGQIHCTWTAVFTIVIDNVTGNAVFSGDGDFTVVGGTGQYQNATGSFQTLFASDPTPLTSDSAVAAFTQCGTINK